MFCNDVGGFHGLQVAKPDGANWWFYARFGLTEVDKFVEKHIQKCPEIGSEDALGDSPFTIVAQNLGTNGTCSNFYGLC